MRKQLMPSGQAVSCTQIPRLSPQRANFSWSWTTSISLSLHKVQMRMLLTFSSITKAQNWPKPRKLTLKEPLNPKSVKRRERVRQLSGQTFCQLTLCMILKTMLIGFSANLRRAMTNMRSNCSCFVSSPVSSVAITWWSCNFTPTFCGTWTAIRRTRSVRFLPWLSRVVTSWCHLRKSSLSRKKSSITISRSIARIKPSLSDSILSGRS